MKEHFFQRLMKQLGFGKTKIRHQMYTIYAVALLAPITVIGIFLMINANKILNNHYKELLNADNQRVKTLLTEMTTQIYQISESICFSSSLKNMLTEDYESGSEFSIAVNSSSTLDSIAYSYKEIEGLYIYTDNPTIKNYKQFHIVTEEIKEQDWYQKAVNHSYAFWMGMRNAGSYGGKDTNLCLVRRITLPDSKYNAVIVIKVSDQYIRSRIDSSIIDAVSVDDSGIIYSSKKNWYGREQLIDIDYDNAYFSYLGVAEADGNEYFISLSTTHLYMTNSKLYVCTLNDSGFETIDQFLQTCLLILLSAIVIPGIILIVFTHYFTNRVLLLREEMHKARTRDYDMITDFGGHDELTEAFDDLKVMVQGIKETDAKMYEAELNEKELCNEQQIMEYKMLASQINPHFLYNALETIRMKAVTTGDKEVANAIKILGKTLRYVLENTGTSYTTLKKELDHIENYIAIQKLRFGKRINYRLIMEDIRPEKFEILPLLLQPVVENAVVHGLESQDGNGQIEVSVSLLENEKMKITVSDNGRGMTEEELENIREKLATPDLVLQSSIGLYNINQRIRLCYGQEYGMEIESRYGEGTQVILYLPAIAESTDF